jgi:NADPH:quinone reductase-like Zn-dependent oxidoreductase
VQDNVGAATWPLALQALARNGRVVPCGSHSGSVFEMAIPQIYHRQLSILGSNGGTFHDLKGHRLLEERAHFGKVVIEIP